MGEGLSTKLVEASPAAFPRHPSQPLRPVILVLAVQRRLFCFGSLVALDVVCGYLLLFLLDIKIGSR